MDLLKASWKTTVSGIIVFLSLFFGEIKKEFDSDDKTHANWNVIVEAAGLLWMGLAARDNNVSSEEAGAKIGGKDVV